MRASGPSAAATAASMPAVSNSYRMAGSVAAVAVATAAGGDCSSTMPATPVHVSMALHALASTICALSTWPPPRVSMRHGAACRWGTCASAARSGLWKHGALTASQAPAMMQYRSIGSTAKWQCRPFSMLDVGLGCAYGPEARTVRAQNPPAPALRTTTTQTNRQKRGGRHAGAAQLWQVKGAGGNFGCIDAC